MKKHVSPLFKIIGLFLVLLLVVLSCKPDPVDTTQFYDTPTAKGRIILPEGADLSYSDIYVKVEETGNQYQVASDGSWAISGLEEGVPYTLYFQNEPFIDISSKSIVSRNGGHHHYGGRKDNVHASTGQGTDNGIVQIKKSANVKGSVTTSDGSSLLGIDIYVPGTSYMAKSDVDGSFTITGLPDGEYRIVAEKYGYITAYSEPFTVLTNESEETVIELSSTLSLVPGTGTIQGSITYEGSTSSTYRPVTVYIQKEDDASVNVTVGSDETGRYTAGDLIPGLYTITVNPDGAYTPSKVEGVSVDAAKTTIVDPIVLVANGGTFKGSVSTYDGKGVTGATVLLTSNAGTESYFTGVASDGTFTISNIVPGNYTYTISMDGYSPYTGSAMISAATVYEITAELQGGLGAVSGKIFLEGVDVYSGITVTLVNLNDSSITYTETTRDDGSFDITGIEEEGSYQVRVSCSGYMSNNSETVSVQIGRVAVVKDITLSSVHAEVRGTVLLEGAATHEGTLLLLRNDTNQYTSTTSTDGSFIITGVVPGTYTLLASKSGYNSKESIEFSVEPSSDKTIDSMALEIGVRSITGSVELELTDDYSGVLVTATNLEDSSNITSAITNSAGTFSLAGLVPGEYLISISKPGYRTMTLETVNVIESQPITLDKVRMEIERGEITGIAKLEGWTDYSGIKVELIGTEYVTETDESGSYSFSVPSGNYTGIRFSKEDFSTSSVSGNLIVLTNQTYNVEDMELKALKTRVKGRIDVLATEDESGVTVSLADTEFTMVTDETGNFEFNHVPLGSYRLETDRKNTPPVTMKFTLSPCPVMDLETITLIPNSASIYGNASLDGKTDHSNIRVTAVPDDPTLPTQTTVTDAGGAFYLGNVVSYGTYTVKFEKEGWDTVELTVSELEPLEERNITEDNPVNLVDTTAPVLESVVINDGANTAADRNVRITLRASDNGSGVSKMQYCFDNRFDETVTMRDYMGSFNVDMPQNNGEKTIYVTVYDGSGNASEIKKATVTLVDQKTEVSSVLVDENLTWTKEKSPYLVTGSVYVKEGDTLTIEPGVDVQFAGPFDIYVDGQIIAEGTEDEHIKFYGIDKGYNTWKGINVPNDDLSSYLNYVDIYDGNYGLFGYVVVENSTIKAQDYALGEGHSKEFNGFLHNVEVEGNAYLNNAVFDNVIVNGDINSMGNCFFFNTLFNGSVLDDSSDGYGRYSYYLYCTFNGPCSFGYWGQFDCIRYSSLRDVSSIQLLGSDEYAFIKYSNMINCGDITVGTKSSEIPILDFQNNFWGYDKTREMDETKNGNVSFINDFYDGDFSLARVDYSNYYRESLQNVGYQGDNFTLADIPDRTYEVGDVGELGGTIFYYDENNEFSDWDYIEEIQLSISLPFGYYRDSTDGANQMVGTSAEIGAGKTNTEKLVEVMGDSAYIEESGSKKGMYAAKFVSMIGSEETEWYQPSLEESKLMKDVDYQHTWSSTESSTTDAYCYYDSGYSSSNQKSEELTINLIHYF